MEARSFDGFRVEETLARLAGTFAVDPVDADLLAADRTVVAIVVAHVTGESSKIMRRTGVVRRVNMLDVNQFAVVREPELQQLLLQHHPQLEGDSISPAEPWEPPELESEWVPPAAHDADTLIGHAMNSSYEEEDKELSDPPIFKSRPPAVPEEDEEVFSPSGSGTGAKRMPVGGASHNDRTLARFLAGMDERR